MTTTKPMKEIRIVHVKTCNFMNGNIDIEVKGNHLCINGPNASGKTRFLHSITYAFDSKNMENRKDFEIKVLDEEGKVVQGLDHTVEVALTVDGVPVTLKKNYTETWKKKPGSNEKQFGSNNTEYFINGVSTTMTDYQAFINSLVPENLFRILITPFGFNELHWTERRSILLEGFGNVTDSEIITLNPALSLVPEILQGSTIEETLPVLRKKFNLTQKEQKKTNLLLGEAKHKIPEELFEPLGEAEMKEKLHSVMEQISSTRQKLETLVHNDRREQLRKGKNRAQEQMDTLKRKQQQLVHQQQDLENRILRLRNRWEVKNEETILYTEMDTCPLCDQNIPEPDRKTAREKAVKRFQEEKQQALTTISTEGKDLALQLATVKSEVAQLGEEQSVFLHTFKCLEEELSVLITATTREETQLRNKLTALDSKEADLRQKLAYSLAADQARNRVAELQEVLQQLEEDLNALESQMMALEEFNRVKMQLLQDRVNQHFSLARFRLFKQLVSGETVECCDTLYKGVPYGSNLNHGHKVQVGMDIVNGLSRRFGLSLPLLVDNRESVDTLPPTNAQVISLCVSRRDSVLRPEFDTSIQPLPEEISRPLTFKPMEREALPMPAAQAHPQAAHSGPDF